jgi:hypothetical protein
MMPSEPTVSSASANSNIRGPIPKPACLRRARSATLADVRSHRRSRSIRRWSAAAILISASGADAAPSSRLVYGRGEGAEECPDESALRRAVAARIGYDPFFPWAPVTVTAEVRRSAGTLRGRITLVDQSGIQKGARELGVASGDCAELVSSMALAISIALDSLTPPPNPDPPPESASSDETPPSRPDIPEADAPPEPRPDASSQSAAKRDTVHLLGALGGHAAFGSTPAPTPGVSVGVEARYRRVGLWVEGRYDLPQTSETVSGVGAIRSYVLAASLAPCLHLDPFFGCFVWTYGRLSGRGVEVVRVRGARRGGLPEPGPTSRRADGAAAGAFRRKTAPGRGCRAPPVAGARRARA